MAQRSPTSRSNKIGIVGYSLVELRYSFEHNLKLAIHPVWSKPTHPLLGLANWLSQKKAHKINWIKRHNWSLPPRDTHILEPLAIFGSGQGGQGQGGQGQGGQGGQSATQRYPHPGTTREIGNSQHLEVLFVGGHHTHSTRYHIGQRFST